MKRHQIFYILFFLSSTVFSQNIDIKAKCVKDFSIFNDTLTIYSRRSTCDTIYYRKFQVFKTDRGLFARQFHEIKIKQPKRCFDFFKPNPKDLMFIQLCTSDIGSTLDYKSLSDFELRMQKPYVTKWRCNEKVSFYMFSKNKRFVNKKKIHCISMLDDLINVLSCVTLDVDVKTGHK